MCKGDLEQMFGRDNAKARIKLLEDTLLDLSLEISSLKASMARINAKVAVEARDSAKGDTPPGYVKRLEKLLKDILGGQVVAIQEPEDVKEKT